MSASIPAPERVWAEVDLAALVANARTVAGVSGARLLPMVKANGYGLGAVAVARALEALDPWGFGVATVAEGVELRDAGIGRPIVVFTPLAAADVDEMRGHALRPVIGDLEALEAWRGAGEEPYHVEVDTGMGRAGVRWDDAAAWTRLADRAGPGWEGVFTHFHSADSPEPTGRQWDRFQQVVEGLPVRPGLVHAANSAAALQGNDYACDLVRPGIFLYGGRVASRTPDPVLRLRCRVVAVRRLAPGDTVSYDATWRADAPVSVATLGIGYADGVPRTLGNRGHVDLAGRRCRIVGNVTMDMTMVALDDPVEVGSSATVIGDAVSLDEQAAAAGTITYELLTGLGTRVHRRYGSLT